MCMGQWATFLKDSDEEDDKKDNGYQFTEAELSAIQALLSFRQVITELLDKVTISWPNLAQMILRSEPTSPINRTPLAGSGQETEITKSSGLGTTLLRGVALSLPFLLPMAPILKRMSTGTNIYTGPGPMPPFIPDFYYNAATHRRRMGRSIDLEQLKYLESIFENIQALDTKYQRRR